MTGTFPLTLDRESWYFLHLACPGRASGGRRPANLGPCAAEGPDSCEKCFA